MKIFPKSVFPLALFALLVLSACSYPNSGRAEEGNVLEVYKSPTCGCCGEWVSHLQSRGFGTEVQNLSFLGSIKRKFNIPANLQSCHTGVSKDGYFFEGHVPAKFIERFLSAPPAGAAGLAVPGMPVGSPGMERGERFSPYSILLVMKDGSIEVYAEVASVKEQY